MAGSLQEARLSYRDARSPMCASNVSVLRVLLISRSTHGLHSWSTRAALDANVASSLHEVRSANVPRLILSVLVQKKASKVLHRVVDLTSDLLIREQERAVRSSACRVIRAVEGRVPSCG